MGAGCLTARKYIMVEHRLPDRALLFGQVADGHDRMVQRIIGLPQITRRVAPPIVHQYVEIGQPFDMMIPKGRYEECIPRLQLGNLGGRERIAETGIGRKIGGREIDHGDWAPGWGDVDRAKIEIGELVGREQSEAATPHGAAGQIIGKVVMRRDAAGIADPQGCQRDARTHRHGVYVGQSVEKLLHIDGAEIDGGGLRHISSFGRI